MAGRLYDIGEKPGKGTYPCVNCKRWTVALDDDDDRLPPCGCAYGRAVTCTISLQSPKGSPGSVTGSATVGNSKRAAVEAARVGGPRRARGGGKDALRPPRRDGCYGLNPEP